MKLNFRKIAAVSASLLMTTMTAGIAAAANFPAPFVDNGVADVAIVYGSATLTDNVQAGLIQSTLGDAMPSTGTSTTVDGENWQFAKTSSAFHLGDGFTTIKSTITKDQLPVLLADGKYIDADNDEIDYTQKIVMDSANTLTMFDEDDYSADDPTIGFKIADGATIATYTLTFTDVLYMTDMTTTELPIMGKNYYVLSNTTTSLTLLDSAASKTISSTETVTLDVDGTTYTVSASIFDATNSKVKLEINGETTNLLGSTETQKLSDGSYLGIKEVIVNNFAEGENQVEFSIGKGKLKISDANAEVQINDQNVAGIEGDLVNGLETNTITGITLAWKASDTEYITPTSSLTMPGFETMSLSYGGLDYPAEESIKVEQGATTYAILNDFPLKTGEKDIYFLYGDSTSFTGIGKAWNGKLLTDANNDVNISFNKTRDDYFVASYTDYGEIGESYLMRATSFVTESAVDKVNIEYWNDDNNGGAWQVISEKATNATEFSLGNIDLEIDQVINDDDTVDIWNTSVGVSFNKLYSVEGLTVYLPWENTTFVDINGTSYATDAAACIASGVSTRMKGEIFTGILQYNQSHTPTNTTACGTNFTLATVEESKTGTLEGGDWINLTIGWDSTSTAEVEVNAVTTTDDDATSAEIGDTKVYRDFTYTALATEILWKKPTTGQKSVELIYHGEEVAADVRITEADAIITSGGASALGDVMVTDAEIATVSDKNLIIVGGSCINSAAATVLGGAYCGPGFTTVTGVGANQFLIKGFDDAFTTGKLALLVAGYESTDTTNAATYLRTQDVDTSMEYKGTSATEATQVVTPTA